MSFCPDGIRAPDRDTPRTLDALWQKLVEWFKQKEATGEAVSFGSLAQNTESGSSNKTGKLAT